MINHGLVAPRRGAWIEILDCKSIVLRAVVAPRRGAWIEINILLMMYMSCFCVAPRRGAWIEIRVHTAAETRKMCRSPQGSVD